MRNKGFTVQVFDLELDPDEMTNLSDDTGWTLSTISTQVIHAYTSGMKKAHNILSLKFPRDVSSLGTHPSATTQAGTASMPTQSTTASLIPDEDLPTGGSAHTIVCCREGEQFRVLYKIPGLIVAELLTSLAVGQCDIPINGQRVRLSPVDQTRVMIGELCVDLTSSDITTNRITGETLLTFEGVKQRKVPEVISLPPQGEPSNVTRVSAVDGHLPGLSLPSPLRESLPPSGWDAERSVGVLGVHGDERYTPPSIPIAGGGAPQAGTGGDGKGEVGLFAPGPGKPGEENLKVSDVGQEAWGGEEIPRINFATRARGGERERISQHEGHREEFPISSYENPVLSARPGERLSQSHSRDTSYLPDTRGPPAAPHHSRSNREQGGRNSRIAAPAPTRPRVKAMERNLNMRKNY
jgi:hypothetical protein